MRKGSVGQFVLIGIAISILATGCNSPSSLECRNVSRDVISLGGLVMEKHGRIYGLSILIEDEESSKKLLSLAKYDTVYRLSVSGPGVNDELMAAISKMSELTKLTISDANLTASGVAYLSSCPSLAGITIANTPIQEQGFYQLCDSPSLREVVVIGSDLAYEREKELSKFARDKNIRFAFH